MSGLAVGLGSPRSHPPRPLAKAVLLKYNRAAIRLIIDEVVLQDLIGST